MSNIIPKKLAIYYGYPSLVNGSTNTTAAVNIYKNYDVIIFGEDLEQTTHTDHLNTKTIVQHSNMTNTEVYGYVKCTRTLSDIQSRIIKWKNIGVKGIFCEEFGYDFGITRVKQNSILSYIHTNNLKAFVDTWNPDDTFGNTANAAFNPAAVPSLINDTDWYLSQSFQIIDGAYQDITFWKTKSDKMKNYKTIFGTNMACITTYDTSAFNQEKMDYAYYSCVLYKFDAFGFGEYLYSAPSAQLPFRDRKTVYGTKFINDIIQNGSKFERQTNIGIHINTTTHTVDYILIL